MPKVFLPAVLIVIIILTGFTLLLTQAKNNKLEQEKKELILKNDSLHIQQLETRLKLTSAYIKIDSLLTNKK